MNAITAAKSGRVVSFGEVLLRLAAPAGEVLLQNLQLEPSICGAEANVAVALAGFGHDARLVTALPANPLGEAARRTLRGFGVAVTADTVVDSRLGLFFLQPGATRPASVTYDRAHSAFAACDPVRYDWPTLLAGADWLFIGGITAALGNTALAALCDAIAAAQSSGVAIAFDTSFRPSLWRGPEAEAAAILCELSYQADLVFAASCAEWAHSVAGDFLRASVADIDGMGAGGGDVRR